MSEVEKLKAAAESLREAAEAAAVVRVGIEALSDLPDPVPEILAQIRAIVAALDGRSGAADGNDSSDFDRRRLKRLAEELRRYWSGLEDRGRYLWGCLDQYVDEAADGNESLRALVASLTGDDRRVPIAAASAGGRDLQQPSNGGHESFGATGD